jgi:hypothetical protein
LVKAPRSAKRASTPVKASNKPLSVRHPSVPLRTKNEPAKNGLKALRTEWSNFARLYIPQQALKSNHIMTIGANEDAILEVPNGCTAKRTTMIAHDTPTIVADEMFGCATLRP